VITINRQQIRRTLFENQKTLSLLLVGIIYVILGAIFPWSTDGYQITKGIDIKVDPLYSNNYNVIIKEVPISVLIIVVSLVALCITIYSLVILNTNKLRILNLLFGSVILYLAFCGFLILKLMLFERGIAISAPINPGFIFTFLGGLVIFADGFVFLFTIVKKLWSEHIR
jgi:hypothetical protein